MYHVHIRITLRPSILDPQGKAVCQALHALSLPTVTDVRTGKHVELIIDTNDAEKADAVAREAARKLLANPVTEDFTILSVLTSAELSPAELTAVE